MGRGQTVTLSQDNTTIAENGTATITATLNASHSVETVISFAPSGTAVLDGDYTVSYIGKNVVKLVKSGLSYPYSIAIDKNGDL